MTTRSVRWPAAAIALLALASSAPSIVNQFTYDDRYIIELNPLMRSLAHWWRLFATSYWPRSWGGDGYRPLTLLSFNIQDVAGAIDFAIFALDQAEYAVSDAVLTRADEPERQILH